MFASPFEVWMMNLSQEIPKHSLHYMTKEEAYEELKKETGQDFGYEVDKWEEWGRRAGKYYPRTGDPRLES